MIEASIVRDKSGFIRQIIIKGHAGFSEYGRDIVCAAVSATAYTAVGALGELAGITGVHEEKDGFMLISIPKGMTEQQKQIAGIILETAVIGLKQIEMEYGRYVKVLDRRCK
ncbi:MAG TPA: ribosomal-processing cysteine protease Prp [Clostridiaceae bacterium]|nr:ribosomal-processing cysteine protease Prp [Clostridiaceae bacterium]